ncbi:hypothetical protein EDD36DRAFT_488589 [Exophiala viscosa]|uniref:Carrier domain-containing protein n=1 Tax=Exophiala viscosa TaxID=2486360 RepID=A0AAN6DVH1_9EURO|nr:hypothetical protein EDD36DRAFT_488589 [Exophiala viscosa]
MARSERPKESCDFGQRLIPHIIDERAITNPDEAYASVPNTGRPQDGFKNISYGTFANAINCCAWWIKEHLGSGPNFETLVYVGPNDLRFSILTVAAVKTGHKAMFISPRNSLAGHLSLLDAGNCKSLLVSNGAPRFVDEILGQRHMNKVLVPDLDYFLQGPKAELYPYDKSFAEARYEPLVALHTSGSTNLPKLVTVKHGTAAAIDALQRLPLQGEHATIPSLFSNKRVFVPFPPFHAAGLYITLPLAVFYGFTVVLPPNVPLTAEVADAVHLHGDVQATILPSSVLTDITNAPSQHANLGTLSFVAFGGSALPKLVGDGIISVSKPVNWLGSTELCFTPAEILDAEDWEYMKFSPIMGAEFRPFDDELYELVIVRDPSLEIYQGVFYTFPELSEYPMQDLYSKHPSKPGLWRYRGRADDIIVFGNGEKTNPVAMETMIESHGMVRSALVIGQGRFQSALLIEPTNDISSPEEKEAALNNLSEIVVRANSESPAHAKVSKELIMFTSPEKPMLRAGKGSVQRKLTLRLYEEEINKLYESLDVREDPSATLPLDSFESIRSSLAALISAATSFELDSFDSDFFRNGMDSLQVINIVRAVNATQNNTKITARTVYASPTVTKLAQVLLPAGVSNNLNVQDEDQIRRIQGITESISSDLPVNARRPMRSDSTFTVVLTGSTGSLGSFLLLNLLRDPKVAKIYCLNRSTNAQERQAKFLDQRGFSIDALREKVEYLHSNFAESYLGLALAKYSELLERTTHILHSSWEVDFNLTFDYFVDTHVRGVRRLIDFSAHSLRDARIFFISSRGTVSQWTTKHASTVPEEVLHDWQVPESIGYAQSKFAAERLLDDARRVAGINCAICRVGQIAGPVSENGIWNKQEWLPSLIASSNYLGKLPSSLGPLDVVDWIPVDLLSNIILDLLFNTSGDLSSAPLSINGIISPDKTPESGSTAVFHAVNPSRVLWADLIPAVLACLDDSVKIVTLDEWVDTLKLSLEETKEIQHNPAAKLSDFFLAWREASVQPLLDTTITMQRSPTMAALKPVTATWMQTWMRQWGYCRLHLT